MSLDTVIAFVVGGSAGALICYLAERKGFARTSLPHPMQRARRGLKAITSRNPVTTRKIRIEQDERRFQRVLADRFRPPPRPRQVPWKDIVEPDNRPRLTPPPSLQARLAQIQSENLAWPDAIARMEEITATVREQLGHIADDGTWIGKAFDDHERPPNPSRESQA